MDRLSSLSTLTLALLLLPACNKASKSVPLERVNAVPAAANPSAAAHFCEVMASAEKAQTFHYPPLAAPAPPASTSARARWVNVWATWCRPCVEELPMLLRWQAQLEKAGAPFDLVLLSLDEDDASVARFRSEHPGTPPSLRIKDPSGAGAWAATLGLDRAAGIPIHVFLDRQGRIRCARAGSVGRDHLPAVQSILGG
jgi:thiol-disulfide isomerase/thioredoxin